MIDNEDPIRAKLRKDSVDPKHEKSTSESEDPNREIPLNDRHEPILVYARMDIELPNKACSS